MKYKILFLFCLGLLREITAQDTICKRTGECFAAKVLEIGVTDVKFKRTDNPDGPLFVYSKNEIKKIKYASGAIDTFAVVKGASRPPLYTNNGIPGYGGMQNNTYNSNMVSPSGRACIFIYRGRTLSDHQLVNMAEDRNETWHDKELAGEIKKTRDSKTLQYATGFGGIGLGVLALLSTSAYSGSSSNAGILTGTTLIGTSLVIASQIVSVRFKVQRNNHGRRLAALYNAHLN